MACNRTDLPRPSGVRHCSFYFPGRVALLQYELLGDAPGWNLQRLVFVFALLHADGSHDGAEYAELRLELMGHPETQAAPLRADLSKPQCRIPLSLDGYRRLSVDAGSSSSVAVARRRARRWKSLRHSSTAATCAPMAPSAGFSWKMGFPASIAKGIRLR